MELELRQPGRHEERSKREAAGRVSPLYHQITAEVHLGNAICNADTQVSVLAGAAAAPRLLATFERASKAKRYPATLGRQLRTPEFAPDTTYVKEATPDGRRAWPA